MGLLVRQPRHPRRTVGGNPVDADEMAHLVDHAPARRGVRVFHSVVEPFQPQSGDGRLLIGGIADGALAVGDTEVAHPAVTAGATASGSPSIRSEEHTSEL